MKLSQENFNEKQNEVTVALSGRVMIALNERIVTVPEHEYNENGEVVETNKKKYQYDFVWIEPEPNETVLECVKRIISDEIVKYDKSASVNEFSLQGKSMWLPRDTRVSLVNSINIEKLQGKPSTTLWFDGIKYEIPVDSALQMLSVLELYALECYNVTHKHLAEIEKFTTIPEVVNYNYKSGYPEKLKL